MPTPQISTFDQLRQFVNTNLADNNSGLIDPVDVRTALGSFIDIQSLKNDLLAASLSPEQSVAWNALIAKLEQIQRDTLSGIKGIATQTNAPTPYTAAQYPNGLFERWIANAPIAAPNNWGNNTVTASELSENTVYFNVTNGTIQKELSPKSTLDPSQVPEVAVEVFDLAVATKGGTPGTKTYPGSAPEYISSSKALFVYDEEFTQSGTLVEISFKAASVHAIFVVIENVGSNLWKSVRVFRWDNEFIVGETYTRTVNYEVKAGQMLAQWCEYSYEVYFKEGGKYRQCSANMYIPGTEGYVAPGTGYTLSFSFKISSEGISGDEAITLLKKFKKSDVATSIPGLIVAQSRGVSPTATAAANTAILNSLIEECVLTKCKLLLPNGIIKHNGIEYRQGVEIQGMGMTNTILKNEGGTYGFRDLDFSNTNHFNTYGAISDLTIDGNNIAEYGLNLRDHFYMRVSDVVLTHFTVACARYEGMLVHHFNNVKFQLSANGFISVNTTNSSYGIMANNLCTYNSCYFVGLTECVNINGASNLMFNSCNFESCVTGITAVGMSPNLVNAVDLTLNNCWSEELSGVWVNLSNNLGTSVIRDSMCLKKGGGDAIINSNSKLLIDGSTYISGATRHVFTTNGGSTRVAGFTNITSHGEASGGSYKTATYA